MSSPQQGALRALRLMEPCSSTTSLFTDVAHGVCRDRQDLRAGNLNILPIPAHLETRMWICLKNAFVSAVQDRNRPDWLCVRARRREHLEVLFPQQSIMATPEGDYAYRV